MPKHQDNSKKYYSSLMDGASYKKLHNPALINLSNLNKNTIGTSNTFTTSNKHNKHNKIINSLSITQVTNSHIPSFKINCSFHNCLQNTLKLIWLSGSPKISLSWESENNIPTSALSQKNISSELMSAVSSYRSRVMISWPKP